MEIRINNPRSGTTPRNIYVTSPCHQKMLNYSKIDQKYSTNSTCQRSGHYNESEGEEKNTISDHVETTEQDNVYERDGEYTSWGRVETSQQDNESKVEEKYTSWGHDGETMS